MATKNKKKIKATPLLNPRRIKIKVIGLGGGGSSIVSEMAQSLSGVSFLIADTDRRVFKKARKGVKVFQFGLKSVGGMGTGMNAVLAEKAALEEKEKIKRIFKDQDLSIIIGSLGGGVASGASVVFSAAAREAKTISIGIFTLPFQFEGDKKMKLAKKTLEKVRQNLSAVVVVPNESIFTISDKKAPLKKSLSALNQIMAQWLGELIDTISRPSLINIDFADLKSILNGQGDTLFFGQAVSAGPSRAEEAAKKIFQNPLLEKPTNVKRILFNITGGKDLSIREVESISREIASLNEKAKIIFGITQSPKYNGKVKIVLMALSDNKAISKEIAPAVKKLNNKIVTRKKVKLTNGKANQRNGQPSNHTQLKPKPELDHREEAPSLDPEKSRRSALEIKEEEKNEEEKSWIEASEWETPAFLKQDKNHGN